MNQFERANAAVLQVFRGDLKATEKSLADLQHVLAEAQNPPPEGQADGSISAGVWGQLKGLLGQLQATFVECRAAQQVHAGSYPDESTVREGVVVDEPDLKPDEVAVVYTWGKLGWHWRTVREACRVCGYSEPRIELFKLKWVELGFMHMNKGV